jgi:hypothetical protein
MLIVKAMEPLRVCVPVVAYLHYFDEVQDPDLNQSESSDPDPHQIKKLGFVSSTLSIGTGGYSL